MTIYVTNKLDRFIIFVYSVNMTGPAEAITREAITTNLGTFNVLCSSLHQHNDVPEIDAEQRRALVQSRRVCGLEWQLVIAFRVHRGRLQVTMKRLGFSVDMHNLWWIDAWLMWHQPVIVFYMENQANRDVCDLLHGLLRDGTVTDHTRSYVIHYDVR